MALIDKGTTPAYKGARFDTDGFCLAHDDVRLCRLTSNGQFKIVRKTCWKCGSAALMTNPKPHAHRNNMHGYRKKEFCREVPSELFFWSNEKREDGGISKKKLRVKAPESKLPPKAEHREIILRDIEISQAIELSDITGRFIIQIPRPDDAAEKWGDKKKLIDAERWGNKKEKRQKAPKRPKNIAWDSLVCLAPSSWFG